MASQKGVGQEEGKRQKKKMKKKSVSFDDLEGGAIRKDTRVLESAPPAREDFTTVMRGAEVDSYEGDKTSFFYSAFDMIPKNLTPMFVYDQAMQARNPAFLKNAILRGVSGHGSHKDPSHIQKAVVHTLKRFPKLLHVYLNSNNLIV